MNNQRGAQRAFLNVLAWTFGGVAVVGGLVAKIAGPPEWNWAGLGVMCLALCIAIPAARAAKNLQTSTDEESHDI
jgi:hypothetical protein